MHLHVDSAMPMSFAICLLRRPAVTSDHDLALAGAKCRETLLERSQCPVALPTRTIAREPGLHSIEEFLITETVL
jgi:hypothetical protein